MEICDKAQHYLFRIEKELSNLLDQVKLLNPNISANSEIETIEYDLKRELSWLKDEIASIQYYIDECEFHSDPDVKDDSNKK